MTQFPVLITLMVGCLLGLAGCLCVIRRAAAGKPPFSPLGFVRDASATATLEVALVFPIALFLMLVLAQTTLAMGSQTYVHYAAFAATRAAIVQIPRDLSPVEPRNSILIDEAASKYGAIRRAAVLSLVPVSGRLTSSPIATTAYTEGLSQHFAAFNMNDPAWLNNLAADRLRYADACTRVTLLRTRVANGDVEFEELDENMWHDFGPREAITVAVEHRLHLAIPYASALFADGSHSTESGYTRYSLVRARYTLTNEGIDNQLPPTPPVDRWPR